MYIFPKLICVEYISILFLYPLKYFCNKSGVRGSIFGHIAGSAKNVPKRISICPGTLVSHFGINLNPQNRYNTLTKTKNKQALKMFAVFWALLDPVFGPRYRHAGNRRFQKVVTNGPAHHPSFANTCLGFFRFVNLVTL